jgi:hypothetical protein
VLRPIQTPIASAATAAAMARSCGARKYRRAGFAAGGAMADSIAGQRSRCGAMSRGRSAMLLARS